MTKTITFLKNASFCIFIGILIGTGHRMAEYAFPAPAVRVDVDCKALEDLAPEQEESPPL